MLARSVDKAEQQTSFQFVDRTTTGSTRQVLVGALSAATAEEQLTGTPNPLTVELVQNTVYVRTTESVLQNDLGLGKNGAQSGAGKWISVQSGDSAFSLLTGPLTIGAEFNNFVPISHLKLGKVTRVGKQRVITVTGTASPNIMNGAHGSAFLVFSAKAPYLPLEGGISLRKGSSQLNEAAAFTDWGKSISVTPPTTTVSYSSLVSQG